MPTSQALRAVAAIIREHYPLVEDADQGGGAFYSEGGGSVEILDSTFESNTATSGSGSGGAILNNETDTALTVTGSSFTDNAAARAGGAIENASLATLTVTSASFSGNDAGMNPGNGGAIHNGGGTVDVTGGTATGNTAVEGGAFWNGGAGDFDIESTSFETNTATGVDASQGGGAIYNEGAGTVEVLDSIFESNTATAGSGSGGAILNIETDTVLTVDGSTFTGNSAARAGGAIENAQGDTEVTDTDFDGNDVAENANPGNGGAIHNGGGDVTVTGGLVGNNSAVEGGGFWTSGAFSVNGTTVTDNVADEEGGAFYNETGGSFAFTDVDATNGGTESDADVEGNVYAEGGGGAPAPTASATGSTFTDGAGTAEDTCEAIVDEQSNGNADDDGTCFTDDVEPDVTLDDLDDVNEDNEDALP